ncbi:hypothetical protein [Neobacillus massiliamazoniensis]|uniref:Uncharacterized protein n=1 Tax=Neobacillus massiliamazoniensis TaxID=1499688 RepID=A0A0U1NQJ0_9BACI|nr:hypothetical protein [Neobacillus massiliamazoniensis]CRK80297.1 hypothetical protein BN000_00178 [Neobacillus massiliamazoniensis]
MFIYVNVDVEGNITNAIAGERIIPDKEYDFFFLRDEITASNIMKFKVVLNGFKADLVLKEGEEIGGGEIPQPNPPTLESLAEESKMNSMAIMELAEIILGGI